MPTKIIVHQYDEIQIQFVVDIFVLNQFLIYGGVQGV